MEDKLSVALNLMRELKDMDIRTRLIFYSDGSGCIEEEQNIGYKRTQSGGFIGIDDALITLASEIQRREYRRNYSRSILDKLLGKNK